MRYLVNENDVIVFENKQLRREIRFAFGKPVCSRLTRLDSGYTWETAETDILTLPGYDYTAGETVFDEETGIVTFTGAYTVRWCFEVSETLPAIRTQIFVKCPQTESDMPAEKTDEIPSVGTETVGHTGRHLSLRAVRFFDKTDIVDSLVRTTDMNLYGSPERVTGNLFIAKDPTVGECCVLLKEAPAEASQLYRTEEDLEATSHTLRVFGAGIDIEHPIRGFAAGYPVVTMLCRDGEEEALCRAWNTESAGGLSSPYIMSNTWGDRSQDTAICEEFMKKEILRAEMLGVDVVQLDAGWHTGGDVNGDCWVPDKKKFPSGLPYLCSFAYDHHVALGLWFSPDATDDYANWEKDAAILLGFFRTCGIRHFKLDGINIDSKKAEKNLLSMCYRILLESEGRVVFQMDITAQKRLGYFYEKALGSLFVENRYTDWGNYYPHNTFRSLWQLAHYIPAQKLQFELLNHRRNPQNYEGDPLAPIGYESDYLFATVMASSPLIWMEMQYLAEEDAARLSGIIKEYKLWRDDFIDIKPVGECPNGYALSGFLITGEKHRYYIGIRENSAKDRVSLPVSRILYTDDDGLTCDGKTVIFSDTRKYFFALLDDAVAPEALC